MIAAAEALPDAKSPSPAPKRCRHRITMTDAEGVARLCAKGHSELHAVAILNKFTYPAWIAFKNRGKRRANVSELFTRTLASRVDNLIEQIATVSDIDRAKAAGVRHDWRAAQFLAGVVDAKFSTSPQSAQIQVNVQVDDAKRARLAAVYDALVVDAAPAALALPEPAEELCAGQIQEAAPEPTDWPSGKD